MKLIKNFQIVIRSFPSSWFLTSGGTTDVTCVEGTVAYPSGVHPRFSLVVVRFVLFMFSIYMSSRCQFRFCDVRVKLCSISLTHISFVDAYLCCLDLFMCIGIRYPTRFPCQMMFASFGSVGVGATRGTGTSFYPFGVHSRVLVVFVLLDLWFSV